MITLDFLSNDYKEKKTPAQIAEENIEIDIGKPEIATWGEDKRARAVPEIRYEPNSDPRNPPQDRRQRSGTLYSQQRSLRRRPHCQRNRRLFLSQEHHGSAMRKMGHRTNRKKADGTAGRNF